MATMVPALVLCYIFSHRLLQRPSRLCEIGRILNQLQQVEEYSDSASKATNPAARRPALLSRQAGAPRPPGRARPGRLTPSVQLRRSTPQPRAVSW